MIIKELNINSFGKLKNIKISFDNNINIIYGENEAGKSTMEAFIKVMLYGFSKRKVNGESERKRYLPFDGSAIYGEMKVIHNNKEYIIKRKFGITKKEDTSVVIDALSGKEVNDINKDEIGKSFLGINRSTFEKTLFVSQLGVVFEKDKEEEIMDKITAVFGCSEEEVPIAQAMDKIKTIKKLLTTVRGSGELDKLKKKNQELLSEKYEAFKICENNLKWEEELFDEKNKKKALESQLTKLEIYKKYLKKIKLQKEYKEITEYLRKQEELKKRESEIVCDLSYGDEIINESYLDSLKNDNIMYINYLNNYNNLKYEKDDFLNKIKDSEEELKSYKFISDFGNNLKDKLLKLKYEQINLKDKINDVQKNIRELGSYEKELEDKRVALGSYILIEDIKDEVENAFNDYEKKLYEMKSIAEENNMQSNVNKSYNKELIRLIASVAGALVGIIFIFIKMPLMIFGIVLLCFSGALLYKSISEIKKYKKIKVLLNEVDEIEDKLNIYKSQVKVKDYHELLTALKKYSNYQSFKEKIEISISEKRKYAADENITEKYDENNKVIEKIKGASGSNTIDELIDKVNEYELKNNKLNSIKVQYEAVDKNYKLAYRSLNDKENEIRLKLKTINLESIDLKEFPKYIDDYYEKINKYRNIHNNLNNIEETYKVLLKDRDINSIKEDLKYIINEDNPYSFESEEEVEIEEKKKNKELLDCVKKVKDLQNNINNRLIGKRDLVTIEEELDENNEEISKNERKVKALDLSLNILEESLDEVRRQVGPEINNKIAENFKMLSGSKYKEVLLNDNYEMSVRDSENLFKGMYLSNGAIDQLYLSLRLAVIDLIFKKENHFIILDDALIQYDEVRRKKALMLLSSMKNVQLIVFTCQSLESSILSEIDMKHNLIEL